LGRRAKAKGAFSWKYWDRVRFGSIAASLGIREAAQYVLTEKLRKQFELENEDEEEIQDQESEELERAQLELSEVNDLTSDQKSIAEQEGDESAFLEEEIRNEKEAAGFGANQEVGIDVGPGQQQLQQDERQQQYDPQHLKKIFEDVHRQLQLKGKRVKTSCKHMCFGHDSNSCLRCPFGPQNDNESHAKILSLLRQLLGCAQFAVFVHKWRGTNTSRCRVFRVMMAVLATLSRKELATGPHALRKLVLEKTRNLLERTDSQATRTTHPADYTGFLVLDTLQETSAAATVPVSFFAELQKSAEYAGFRTLLRAIERAQTARQLLSLGTMGKDDDDDDNRPNGDEENQDEETDLVTTTTTTDELASSGALLNLDF
jgi:hypothetical protein